jgi:[acyl-carrier-protein] S-malonyltransferase
MGKSLYDQYPSAKLVFDELHHTLGLRSLVFDGPQEALTLTENAQPAILTTSIALLRVLEAEFGFDIENCRYALGHSLGEYTALVATKSISLTDALKLVHLRGKAMSKAVTGQDTAMSALLLRKNKLAELKACVQQIQHEGDVVAIANMNSVSNHHLALFKKSLNPCI